jgi:hypothetical protein
MQIVEFNGWDRNARLSNGEAELIVTLDVGPRVIRYGFRSERNLFAEMDGQQGGADEADWMLRGGHRLWVAPEVKPDTYELDNSPIGWEEISGGIRTRQERGPLTGIVKSMDITMASEGTDVTILHTLQNAGQKTVRVAPWALTVMAPGGTAVIPLPPKISHTERLTHNQEWSIWPYTDLSDPRWTFGSRFLLFKQDRRKGPAKIGIAHREGWVGYALSEFLFVKRFEWTEGAVYPDGGVNFETFSNEDFLEVESLGGLVDLAPGQSVTHEEQWELHRNVPRIVTPDDAAKHVLPLVR